MAILRGLLDPEDEGTILRKVWNYQPNDTSQPKTKAVNNTDGGDKKYEHRRMKYVLPTGRLCSPLNRTFPLNCHMQ